MVYTACTQPLCAEGDLCNRLPTDGTLCGVQIYTALRNRIVAAQPLDRQAHLSQCLDKLMADVQRNLEPKNRDKFTQVGSPYNEEI